MLSTPSKSDRSPRGACRGPGASHVLVEGRAGSTWIRCGWRRLSVLAQQARVLRPAAVERLPPSLEATAGRCRILADIMKALHNDGRVLFVARCIASASSPSTKGA